MHAPPLATVDPTLRAALAGALAEESAFAAQFYERLFQLAPAARSLFPADLQAQQDKLGRSLVMLIKCLDEPDVLVPELRQLGARHLLYGVRAPDYLLVGQALADTIAARLEAAATPDLLRQWQQLYGWIAATMIGGAEAAQPNTLQG